MLCVVILIMFCIKQSHILVKNVLIKSLSMAAGTSELPSVQALLEGIVGKPDTPATEVKAHNFCLKYSTLPLGEKQKILKYIAVKYDFNNDNVKKAAESFLSVQDKNCEIQVKAAERLKSALTPFYNDAFNIIRKLDCGVKFLVDLRADLLDFLCETNFDETESCHLKALNNYLKDMLLSSFNVGFLSLERITWESSCDMLQKISEYEAVHPVKSWTDLKQRVGPYRRCYVFTHSSMRKEPLVVLHTALTEDISSSISSIVSHRRMHSEGDITNATVFTEHAENPDKVQAAVFYSITSTQKGLRGIELGNQLIKKVVREVLKEFPHIVKLSTLSPIPGFREWLLVEIKKLNEAGESVISSFLPQQKLLSICEIVQESETNVFVALGQLIKSNRWINNSQLTDCLQMPLLKACAHYLYKEKRRSYALNGVAHFHLRNGAVLWRLNWLADLSPRGLNGSCGIMANYRYYIDETEQNSKKYIEDFEITISDNIKRLLTPDLNHSSL